MKTFKKQINNHIITWSNKEKRYIIKKGTKRVYDVHTLTDAKQWIKRNT